ncbi:pyroglutamyl-peptidase [Planctomycetaceae bacterium]|nr:pyroglutamyl-peptidase [Planctomycetaceae bacterium]
MARVLLTGFEPFGSFKRNPSWDALKLAEERGLLPRPVSLAQIPVTYAGAFKALKAAARRFKPDVIVCFGVHGSRESRTLYLECVAHNRNGSAPDNDGVTREGKILPRKPRLLESSYPFASLAVLLKDSGFSVEISGDAGGYLCNHLYFRASEAFGRKVPVAFVHVPPVRGKGTMKVDKLARAIALVAWHTGMTAAMRKR